MTRVQSVPPLTCALSRPAFKPLPMKGPDVDIERRSDGSILITSRHQPGLSPQSIAHVLKSRALTHPDRPFIRQREGKHGPWRTLTYGQALQSAEAVAAWLISQGLRSEDCVMVISGNSIEHAVMMLGCYTAGVPISAISPAYALMAAGYSKLRHAFESIRPKVVFAQGLDAYAGALSSLKGLDPALTFVTVDGGAGVLSFAEVTSMLVTPAVDAAREALSHETVAKYLFTSGSTGLPKAVPQTHGMMVGVLAGQDGLKTESEDPENVGQFLEWMPWSHISAGNISFNSVLSAGGTIYLDEGKPAPGHFETTIRNLSEVSPTVYGSAPIAFSMLADAMERDPKLRKAFFKNLRYMVYGGAALANDVYERIQALAIMETGMRIPLTTMLGATETQTITATHWATERVGLIGLPLPGVTLKLAPYGAKYELRVKGTTVAAGYKDDPAKSATAFDEEGFYRLGDAARFLDPEDPSQGLVFDGRLTEDFKLDSGTWVSVGTLRLEIIAACSPYLSDVVIAGHDQRFISALLWLSTAFVANQTADEVIEQLKQSLRAFNATAGGSSRRVARFVILTEPASISAGEITDKGYVNQRAVLDTRAALVDRLYRDPAGEDVTLVSD